MCGSGAQEGSGLGFLWLLLKVGNSTVVIKKELLVLAVFFFILDQLVIEHNPFSQHFNSW